MQYIDRYFPDLSEQQLAQFDAMLSLYPEWNAKINVISRKDIDNLEVNHILHSLAIAKFISFAPGSKILDFGCGGGLPGIPLAAMFPDCHFHLIDRIGKKLRVASSIAEEIGLTNVTFQHGDIAECKEKFDFVVSRAVMNLPDLIKLCRKNISGVQKNHLPNGVITLKGGDLDSEMAEYASMSMVENITRYFTEEFFETKKITYTQVLTSSKR
ncbi:MAG: 16S rRNA (guanine(527)-N(7))-methyltransferase RsmG [Muribaculaceae bacterium]|nr:16S rRNA (guanine(527)-N(7))-methyltransferase RsmG [Muribaculaceae bacterium]MBQ2371259.1 16S rRNA (guanine(527)-N(7))-methyltransferase RsmG [Muribaculaceae bacterium]MEE1365558.1 16S rRNA (guanine(527)-N(7))-methyltransferase RsmG [Muribaculaceae bacterium]